MEFPINTGLHRGCLAATQTLSIKGGGPFICTGNVIPQTRIVGPLCTVNVIPQLKMVGPLCTVNVTPHSGSDTAPEHPGR